MVKAVLFDVDGVIANSEGAKADSWATTFEENDVRDESGVRIDGRQWYLERVGTHGRDLCAAVINDYGVERDVDELFGDQVACSKSLEARAGIIRTTVDFIRQLDSIRVLLGAASSNYTDVVESHLRRAGVFHAFNAVSSGVDELDANRQKPAPDIYLLTAEKLGVDPSECIGVDDTVPGVQAVKAAGMYAIGFLNPDSGMYQDLHEAGADLRVNDLSMLNARRLLSL